MEQLTISGHQFRSRLLLGTGKFSSASTMREALIASGSELVTVALKRVSKTALHDDLVTSLRLPGITLVPNTSGARTAQEAVFAAELGREALGTDWIKLEIHPNPRHLMPDPIETLAAAEALVKKNFIVLPYVHADPVLCKRLEEVGVAAVMPLAAPIGTNLGLEMKIMIELILSESRVPVIVDAGLGAPSHAAAALEMGAAAVLVNTAIAVAGSPVEMARAFRGACEAGRLAYEAKLAAPSAIASASSPFDLFEATTPAAQEH